MGTPRTWRRDGDRALRRIRPRHERGRDDSCRADDVHPYLRMTEERRGAMLDDLRAQGRILSELVGWLPAFNARRP